MQTATQLDHWEYNVFHRKKEEQTGKVKQSGQCFQLNWKLMKKFGHFCTKQNWPKPTTSRALPKATFKEKIQMILLKILENEDF